MRNLKYLFLSIGILFISLGGIKFYNQDYAPQMPALDVIYNILHGTFNDSSYWPLDKQAYNLSKLHNEYFYNLEYIDLNSKHTVFHFTITKVANADKDENIPDETEKKNSNSTSDPQKSIKENDPFPYPIMKLAYGYDREKIYPLTYKESHKDEFGNLLIDLYFPVVANYSGDIKFWCDYNEYSGDYDRLFLLSPPSTYSPNGPNLWGFMFFVGLIIFVIATFTNPLKSINKQIIESEGELDYAKKRSIERLSQGKAYGKLTPEIQYRYDTMMDFYNNAQNLILESYKLYTEKSSFSFEILFKSIVVIGIVFLFVGILVSGFNIFLPDTIKLFHTSEPNFVIHGSGFLNERITNLEVAKLSLTFILLGVLFIGILSTVATYAINVWKVRSVARTLVGKKIETFNIKMKLEIENSTVPIDTKLISLGNKFSSIENSITQGTYKINEISDSTKKQFNKLFKTEKKILYKNLKLHKKQFRMNISNLFRR